MEPLKRLQPSCQPGLQLSEGFTGAGESASKTVHSHSRWFEQAIRERDIEQGEREGEGERDRERQRETERDRERQRGHRVFYNIISDVTYHHFPWILLVTQPNLVKRVR